jgi:hypothetical protein
LRPLPALLADAREKRLDAIGHLRGCVLDDAFSGLQPGKVRPAAIPAPRLAPALVVAPAERIRDLRLERILYDLQHPKLRYLGQRVAIGKIAAQSSRSL